ncbi:P-loop NTPase family protein [Flindersiella endophytica]
MERVLVVGCCGGGKSYVARAIGQLTGAPVTHLDAMYYDDEWNTAPMDDFADAQRELVARPRWVIDGNYNSTLEIRLRACDTVVFVDVPTRSCLWGIFSRHVRRGGEHQLNLDVVKYVLGYRRTMRPRVLAKLEEYAGHARVVSLHSRARARQWLVDLADQQLRESAADVG